MNDPTKIADHLASKDPQYIINYLLIFVMIAGAGATAWMFKWLVGRLQNQTTLLAGLFKEASDGRERVASIVAENTAVIRECRDQITENTEFLRRANDNVRRA